MESETDTTRKLHETAPLLNDLKHTAQYIEQRTLKERLWRYGVLCSSFLSFALSAGFSYGIAGSITVAQSRYFNVTFHRASWSVAAHTVFFLIMSPASAMIAKMISIRKVQLLGCIMSILGIGLCGFSTEPWHVVLLFGVLAGVGLSFTRVAIFGILPYHFEKQNLHMAIATASTGYFAGYLFVPVATSYLFMRFGFNHAMFLASTVMLLHLIGVVFYSQSKEVVRKEPLSEETSLKSSLKNILTDLKLWLFLLSSCVRKFGLSAFYTIYQDYADHELQLSLTESGTAATIYGAVAVCACAVVSVTHAYGWTYNKILALTTTALLQGVSILLVSTSASEGEFYLYTGLLGLFHGVYFGNLMCVGSEIVGEENLVLIVGFDTCAQGIGGLVGPSTASYLQDHVGYKLGMYSSGSAVILCGVLTALIGLVKYLKYRQSRQKEQECGNRPQ